MVMFFHLYLSPWFGAYLFQYYHDSKLSRCLIT
jgi:hypothetical protein